jgi:23S rRNA pseudouridine1911/1915/1917 synthase
MEQQWKVRPEDSGKRLDAWLCGRLAAVSRKQVKSMIDAGRVRVGGRRVVIAGWKLAAGDAVAILSEKAPREKSLRGKTTVKRAGSRREERRPPARRQRLRLHVYYADRDLIIVEKPAGILSVPQPGVSAGDDLTSLVRAHLRQRYPESPGSHLVPLHRLDAETSGVMVFALSSTGERLERQFRDHSIRRAYVAVVAGAMERSDGVIDRPLAKGEFGAGRKVRLVAKGEGVRAVTEYRVEERYRDATVLVVRVRTGRTHQIRAHLASEGHPIVGDAVYAGGRGPAVEGLGFRRHALHASVLGFKHPATKKPLLFRSPLPQDMRDLIDRLRDAS